MGWLMDGEGKTPGAEILVPVLVCFVLVSWWCVVEAWRNWRQLRSEPDLASSSAGWEMRKYFHVLLGISNVGRCGAIIAQLSLDASSMEECIDMSCWAIGFVHAVPDLLFLTTYSLLTLFWAQLYYTTWGFSYASIRPGFFIGNAVFYTVFLIISVVSGIRENYQLIRVDAFYMLAAAYVASTAGMVYYGVKVIVQLQPSAVGGYNQSFPARRRILCRVILLCGLCSIVMVGHTVYCILAVTVYKDNLGYPEFTSKYGFDAISYCVFELVPSVVLLALTCKRNPAVESETDNHAGIVETFQQQRDILGDSSTDMYAPMQSTPSLLEGRESLAARLLRSDHDLEQQSRQSSM